MSDLRLVIKLAEKRLKIWSSLRFAIFIAFLISIYFLEVYNHGINYLISGLLILGFITFLVYYFKVKGELKRFRIESKVLSQMKSLSEGELSPLGNGLKFRPDNHEYELDLDILGEGSMFHRLNLCSTIDGQRALAELLMDNKIDLCWDRKNWVEELESNFEFRLQFLKSLEQKDIKNFDADLIQKILKAYKFPSINRFVLAFFPWLSLMFLLVVIFTGVNFSLLLIWGLCGLSITAKYVKSVNEFSAKTYSFEAFLRAQSEVLTLFSSMSWNSKIAQIFLRRIREDDKSVSDILKILSRRISNLDQRHNMFFGILANAFLLWDIIQLNHIKSWFEKHEQRLKDWSQIMAELEAWVSLSTYSSHLEGVYAQPSEDDLIMAMDLAHPLILAEHRIGNEFKISEGSLWIITGANMAGKSTFLRSVGWAVVSANLGLKICAKEFKYKPISLISSMRTSDSLISKSSYFQAELKRLSFVKERLEKDVYLVLLDEILKGTNSVDKAEGSKRFLKKIHKNKSTILVATHDLSLCELDKEVEQVENYAFEASFDNEEMSFDYTLKKGICTDMNASYLLKKLGLS